MKKPLRRVLRCALQWRCPNCERGRLFGGWLKMLRRCPECGLTYYPESGFYVGAMIINYVVTAMLVTALYFALWLVPDLPGLSWGEGLAAWMAFAVALSLALMRHSYSLWLSLVFWVSPWQPVAGEASDFGVASRTEHFR